MSGRHEQLGRQLRKVRSALANHEIKPLAVALRRATHLGIDLVLEQVEGDDAASGVRELATRRVVDAALAERLAAAFTAATDRERDRDKEPEEAAVLALGRDLDRLLRSLEHGAPMPELPFTPLAPNEIPGAESRAALTVSGRHVVVAARGGEGMVFVDERPVGRPFPMLAAPQGKAAIARDPSGTTTIAWEAEGLAIELGPDFASAAARIV